MQNKTVRPKLSEKGLLTPDNCVVKQIDLQSRMQSMSDSVRLRAYLLFEMRGRQSGHELEDWLQAEREEKERLGI